MIITMAQRKGGSGKSTLAINIATELARRGHKTGMLDTDPQKTTEKWFKRRTKKDLDTSNLEVQGVIGSIKDTIIAMAGRNEHLIIDTAGLHSDEMRQAVVKSTVALAPFRPKQYDLEQAADLMAIFKHLEFANPKLHKVAVISSASTNHKDSRADDATAFLENKGFDVLGGKVCYRESYGDTGALGLGACEFEDKKAQEEIAAIVDELFGGEENEQ